MELSMKQDQAIALYTDGTVEEEGVYGSYTKQLGFPSNRDDLIGKALPIDRLLGLDGRVIDLDAYRGQRVLVVMLGFAGQVCLYCSTQTRVITEKLPEFTKRQCQVIFVYPGSTSSVGDFLRGVSAVGGDPGKIPGVGLDVNTQWVQKLNTKGDVSQPSSFIIDREGKIAYAYVGADKVDRPSAAFLLDILDDMP